MDDFELDKIFDVPFVFWMCPRGCRGFVDWNEGATVATCRECGTTSADPPANPGAGPGQGRE